MELKEFITTTVKSYLKEQQETPTNINNNFKKWFGDSKIIDSNGNPIICYHGSNTKNIKIFNLDFVGKNTDSGMYGKGFYFTDNIKYADTYNRTKNGDTLEVYLKISNPLIINNKFDIPKIHVPDDTLEDLYNGSKIYSEKFRQFLIENNYDGVVANMFSEKQFVALYPNQIKSVNNDGSWDIDDNNIFS